MSTEVKKEIELEIVHVLFIDTVGYSKLLIDDQRDLIDTLNQIVRGTAEFQSAEAAGKLIKIATGDGMALAFYNRLEAPAECALQISRALKEHPELRVRMGVHSGPVSGVIDVNERANVAGAGINMARRVMECGDAGHILLSQHIAEDLEHYGRWGPHLHDLGECEVKHGARVHVFNLYTDKLGNPELPEKFGQVASSGSAIRSATLRWARVLCRGHSGRNPDPHIQDRRSEGHLAHIDAALQKRAGKLVRDRQATECRPHPGRKRAEERRRRARERPAD